MWCDFKWFVNLAGNDDATVKWCFSQVKGTCEEEITEGKFF